MNQIFGLRVGECGGFVEDQDRGVGQQRAGNGEPLLFAAGELSVGIQHGVIPVGQTQDPLMDLRITGC
ncbi:Uncharacterised protein [Mycobacteroides abscessus subsp. abscessus]|nr:Uncharacterised protein [Mycobacteroides abscessus subsp. abscessus]